MLVELLWVVAVGSCVALAALLPCRGGAALAATALPPLGLLLALLFC